MDQADAHAIVSLLDAEWPKGAWLDDDGELTVRGHLFAAELGPFDSETGVEAVTRLRRRGVWSHEGPHTSDLLAVLREVTHERELSDSTQRLALEDGISAAPEEAQAILRTYFEKVGRPLEIDAKHAAQRGDLAAKHVAGMMLAQRRIEEVEPPWERPEFAQDPTKGLTACGVKWGTPQVQNEAGEWVCPNCGRTAEEGCA